MPEAGSLAAGASAVLVLVTAMGRYLPLFGSRLTALQPRAAALLWCGAADAARALNWTGRGAGLAAALAAVSAGLIAWLTP